MKNTKKTKKGQYCDTVVRRRIKVVDDVAMKQERLIYRFKTRLDAASKTTLIQYQNMNSDQVVSSPSKPSVRSVGAAQLLDGDDAETRTPSFNMRPDNRAAQRYLLLLLLQ